MIKVGDKVCVRALPLAVAVRVKAVTSGGTITLREAVGGRRCFEESELYVVSSSDTSPSVTNPPATDAT